MPAPVLQALLVADQIYQDQATGKFVICGIFGTIYFHPNQSARPAESDDHSASDEDRGSPGAPGQPVGPSGNAMKGPQRVGNTPQQMPINQLMRAGSPYAYVSLTEVHGQRMFQLRYVDLSENVEVFSVQFGVDGRNPLDTIQISIPLPTLPVVREGVFALELLCQGELLGSHRVLTKLHPGSNSQDSP